MSLPAVAWPPQRGGQAASRRTGKLVCSWLVWQPDLWCLRSRPTRPSVDASALWTRRTSWPTPFAWARAVRLAILAAAKGGEGGRMRGTGEDWTQEAVRLNLRLDRSALRSVVCLLVHRRQCHARHCKAGRRGGTWGKRRRRASKESKRRRPGGEVEQDTQSPCGVAHLLVLGRGAAVGGQQIEKVRRQGRVLLPPPTRRETLVS